MCKMDGFGFAAASLGLLLIISGTESNKFDTVNILWPGAVVPYKVSKSIVKFDKNNTLQQVIDDIQGKTCIRFVKRQKERNYLDITAGFDCVTRTGYAAQPQLFTVMVPMCLEKKRLLRNILHVLGLPNEQQRPDRDDYIRIDWDNVEKLDTPFLQIDNSTNLPFNEMPYDYNSILHADAFYKAKNNTQPTIYPIVEGISVGRAEELSALDVQKLNLLYC